MRSVSYHFAGPRAGRIAQVLDCDAGITEISVPDTDEILLLLPAPEGETDLTHYVAWTETDAAGRPLDPALAPRTLLTAEVAEGAGLSTVTISGAEGIDAVVIKIDGQPQAPEPPAAGQVVVEIESPVARSFAVEVDEVTYYLPRLAVSVR